MASITINSFSNVTDTSCTVNFTLTRVYTSSTSETIQSVSVTSPSGATGTGYKCGTWSGSGGTQTATGCTINVSGLKSGDSSSIKLTVTYNVKTWEAEYDKRYCFGYKEKSSDSRYKESGWFYDITKAANKALTYVATWPTSRNDDVSAYGDGVTIGTGSNGDTVYLIFGYYDTGDGSWVLTSSGLTATSSSSALITSPGPFYFNGSSGLTSGEWDVGSGIQTLLTNIYNFDSHATKYMSYKKGTQQTACSAFGSSGSGNKLTATMLQNAYKYMGSSISCKSGDKITLSMFTGLEALFV